MPDFEEITLGRAERGKKTAMIVALVVFVFYFVIFRGPAEGYWDTYIAVPASLVAGEAVDFRANDGTPAYDYALARALPDDLVAPESFGIATKDQRIGAGVQAAPFFQAFRVFGFRVLYALLPALAALLFFGFVQRVTGRRWVAAVTALALTLNPFVISFQAMNANFGALMLIAALFLVLDLDPFRPFVAGLLFGVMGGLRNMAVIYGPLLVLWAYGRGRNESPAKGFARKLAGVRSTGLFILGALLSILPFTYWKEFAFGSPIAHPSQYPHFQGFRPTFPHSFLGLEFQFNGLLNYPFAEEWVRTPHFPFPVFLLIPMVFVASFGMLLGAITILGISPSFRERKSLSWAMMIWLLISGFFWSFQENWEELKMSFLFLALPAFCYFMAFGLQRLTAIGELQANLVKLGGIILAAIVILKFSFFLEFPQDERWYQRFPKAGINESGLNGLPEEERLAPEFFLTRETEEEHLRVKERMTSICLLPCRYLPLRIEWDSLGTTMGEELSRRKLTVQGVWDKIYAQMEKPDP